jgi:hypothetical protein
MHSLAVAIWSKLLTKIVRLKSSTAKWATAQFSRIELRADAFHSRNNGAMSPLGPMRDVPIVPANVCFARKSGHKTDAAGNLLYEYAA